jgi:UMF1 family MFS transporter
MILGIFVGCAIGAAGAQARSMFTRLIPETRTTEFFGFFGFIGKAAAMIGPFLYALAVSQFDSRVALLTIAIVILLGTLLASCVNLEEGERVAAMEDARIRGEVFAEE